MSKAPPRADGAHVGEERQSVGGDGGVPRASRPVFFDARSERGPSQAGTTGARALANRRKREVNERESLASAVPFPSAAA